MMAARTSDPKFKRRIVLDVLLLLVYVAAANPGITGVPVHEWIGCFAFVALALHCASRGAIRTSGKAKAPLSVLNVALLFCLVLCIVSGVMISGTVLAFFGLYAEGYYFWNPLHAVAAKLLLALLLIHIAVHIPWAVDKVKKWSERDV